MFTQSQVLQKDKVYLALYKAKGNVVNGIIRAWEGSPYSHAELVVNGEGYSSSMRDGGVRIKAMPFSKDKWDLLPLDFADAGQIRAWFVAHDGIKYGYLDLLFTKILRLPGNKKGMFCYEAIASALGFVEPHQMTAARLLELCHEKNLSHHVRTT